MIHNASQPTCFIAINNTHAMANDLQKVVLCIFGKDDSNESIL